METGVIRNLNLGRGFGFVRLDNGRGDAFFHLSALGDGLEWNEQLLERRVCCDVEKNDRGLKAIMVCAER